VCLGVLFDECGAKIDLKITGFLKYLSRRLSEFFTFSRKGAAIMELDISGFFSSSGTKVQFSSGKPVPSSFPQEPPLVKSLKKIV
jgi:hypothetical protein